MQWLLTCVLLLLTRLHCRWGKPVIVYGPPSLAKDHPVVKFLAQQQRCASVSYFKQGCVTLLLSSSSTCSRHCATVVVLPASWLSHHTHPAIQLRQHTRCCFACQNNICRYEAFAAKYPFLCTTSVKANSYKK